MKIQICIIALLKVNAVALLMLLNPAAMPIATLNTKKSFSCSCSQSDSLTGDCTYLQYCEGFPVWAIILIIVVALVLVLAVILLVFFMMRRRRQYDTI